MLALHIVDIEVRPSPIEGLGIFALKPYSCDPNAYEQFDGDISYLVARRQIAIGDEINLDYNINISNGTVWPCHCGARRCRGEVAGDFFRLPLEWQREYRPLLAEWFIDRHRSLIETLDRDAI